MYVIASAFVLLFVLEGLICPPVKPETKPSEGPAVQTNDTSIRMINDNKSVKMRGYAFIEYEHERDMHSAYKHADGRKIDGRRVLVDVERGRTVKGWRPQRLGGGLGGTRKGGPEENTRFSGRDEFNPGREGYREERAGGRERSRSRERERVGVGAAGGPGRRARSRERERRRSSSRERGGGRVRSRSRSRERRRSRDREEKVSEGEEEVRVKDRKRRRSRSRERRRSRSRDHKVRGSKAKPQ